MTTNESEILEKRLTNVINMVKESETSRKDPGSGTALVLEFMSDRVSRDSVEYLAKVSVSNPYSTSIPICEIKDSRPS
ncbi:hypothetical protein JHK82_026172 [Glycine max]|nr:hypothetical protein JHK85_026783 [Glycine max]KAG5134984.1 hypothetical protein JHK82_026172 [Glycine max]